MKAAAELGEDFARIEVVRAAESETVVVQYATVGDVDGLEIDKSRGYSRADKEEVMGGS